MKKTLIILLNILIVSNVFAQSIKGTIKNQSGEGIVGASVAVLNTPKGSITDKNGAFEIALSKGKYNVSISAIGFASKIESIVVSGTTTLDITLKESSQELSEVVVTADKTETNLLNTPVAVSSISAKKVEDARIWELANLTAIVPNYLYSELGVAF